MAEFTYVPIQLVDEDENVTFNATPVRGCKCIDHREGSGIVTLRGLTDCCFARYRVSFGGNSWGSARHMRGQGTHCRCGE